jgi:hypothetical protein
VVKNRPEDLSPQNFKCLPYTTSQCSFMAFFAEKNTKFIFQMDHHMGKNTSVSKIINASDDSQRTRCHLFGLHLCVSPF